MNIDGGCILCNSHTENINHLLRTSEFTREVWSTLSHLNLVQNNRNLQFIVLLDYIYNNNKIYSEISHSP